MDAPAGLCGHRRITGLVDRFGRTIEMVVMTDVNDSETSAMVNYCIDQGFTLRFIETMPVGDTGRAASAQYLSLQEVRRLLEREYALLPATMNGGGPARYVQVAGTELRIGFIAPISQHFCGTCNRVRLAVDGTLYACLGQDDKLALRPLLRSGIGMDELKGAIVAAIALKPERHGFVDRPEKVIRFMSYTGG